MSNPFKLFTKRDYFLWITSLIIVLVSNILPGQVEVVTLIATLLGATSLMFLAKGNAWTHVLTTFFCFLYAIVSYRYRYWGEIVTYLGMTMPMAVWSLVTWLRNPSREEGVVEIRSLTIKGWVGVVVFNVIVTFIFYLILDFLKTPNIFFSTLSIFTSFGAASLTMLRSSYYALWYAANDVVLIVLWIFAAIENPVYIPMIANFGIFLVADLYGFWNWKKREEDNS